MSHASPEDLSRTLLTRLREGDAEAGALLEQLHREPLRRFALRYLHHADDAEDVVQEVFARALESKAVPDQLRAWLYRVARNLCLNQLRAGRVRDGASLPTGLDLAADQTGNLTRLARVEEREALERQLARLSDAQREALLLRYVEGLGREEIALVLEVPASVVKSRLYEGVARLRRLV